MEKEVSTTAQKDDCPVISVKSDLHFKYNDKNFIYESSWSEEESRVSQFDKVLMSRWDQAAKDGLFRFLVYDLKSRVLPGPLEFVAQLNTKRATDRRKPQEINSLDQPFNPQKFNFTKVRDGEIIMELCQSNSELNGNTECSQKKKDSKHIIVINVSPLEYCSLLLVPYINDHLPQRLTQDAIQVAIEMQLLSAKRSLRVGWNSLCALASVNHLHFHAYYMKYPLKIEDWPTRPVKGPCHELIDWPMVTYVFQLVNGDVKSMARDVYTLCSYFHEHDIAHNMFMVRGCGFNEQQDTSTVRINIFPRASTFGVKSEDAFNVALCELAGHLPIKVAESFETLTEDAVIGLMHEAALPYETLDIIRTEINTLYS